MFLYSPCDGGYLPINETVKTANFYVCTFNDTVENLTTLILKDSGIESECTISLTTTDVKGVLYYIDSLYAISTISGDAPSGNFATETYVDTNISSSIDAISYDTAIKINEFNTKITPVSGDWLMLSDSADSFKNKKVAYPTNVISTVAFADITGSAEDNTSLSNVLDTKAPLSNPQFNGIGTCPTAGVNTSTIQLANCNYVAQQIALIPSGSSPAFADITGSPYDNANLDTALEAAKYPYSYGLYYVNSSYTSNLSVGSRIMFNTTESSGGVSDVSMSMNSGLISLNSTGIYKCTGYVSGQSSNSIGFQWAKSGGLTGVVGVSNNSSMCPATAFISVTATPTFAELRIVLDNITSQVYGSNTGLNTYCTIERVV
jgi:hypothetical protein